METVKVTVAVVVALSLGILIGDRFRFADGPPVHELHFTIPQTPPAINFYDEATGTITAEAAITWMGPHGWHEGKNWTFKDLIVDGSTHTVSGNCPSLDTALAKRAERIPTITLSAGP
jgi:hypothetical protein